MGCVICGNRSLNDWCEECESFAAGYRDAVHDCIIASLKAESGLAFSLIMEEVENIATNVEAILKERVASRKRLRVRNSCRKLRHHDNVTT